jgi:hypothetical protein
MKPFINPKRPTKQIAALVTVSVTTGVAAAATPVSTEFSTPRAGITAPILGGTALYRLRQEITGVTEQRGREVNIWSFELCTAAGGQCRQAQGLDVLRGVPWIQSVWLVDQADRPTIVAYDGVYMILCHATSYSTATVQGFACGSQWINHRTTAPPVAVRGYNAQGKVSYSVAFDAPATPATFEGLPAVADEVRRNNDLTFALAGYALTAAQQAGVPMTRRIQNQPCFEFSPFTTGRAQAMRIVPLCGGGGGDSGGDSGDSGGGGGGGSSGGDFDLGMEGPVNLSQELERVKVEGKCHYGDPCWPVPAIEYRVDAGGGLSSPGVPLRNDAAPTPGDSAGTPNKGIQPPKQQCTEKAEEDRRSSEVWCAQAVKKLKDLNTYAGSGIGAGGGAVIGVLIGARAGWLGALAGGISGVVVGAGGVMTIGGQAADTFGASCDATTKANYNDKLLACAAISE